MKNLMLASLIMAFNLTSISYAGTETKLPLTKTLPGTWSYTEAEHEDIIFLKKIDEQIFQYKDQALMDYSEDDFLSFCQNAGLTPKEINLFISPNLSKSEEEAAIKAQIGGIAYDCELDLARSGKNYEYKKEKFLIIQEDLKKAILKTFVKMTYKKNNSPIAQYDFKLEEVVITIPSVNDHASTLHLVYDGLDEVWNVDLPTRNEASMLLQ